MWDVTHGQKPAEIWTNLAKMAGIWPDSAIYSEESGRNPTNLLVRILQRRPNIAGFLGHLPNSDFCILWFFSCESNAGNYFRKNHFFFLKIILPKIFYDGNYFTSKQREHNWFQNVQYIRLSIILLYYINIIICLSFFI